VALAAGLMAPGGPLAANNAQVAGLDLGEWRRRLDEAEERVLAGEFRQGIEVLQKVVEFGQERLLVLEAPEGAENAVEGVAARAPEGVVRLGPARPAANAPGVNPRAAGGVPSGAVYVPAAELARRRLAALPAEGLRVYRELYEARARRLLEASRRDEDAGELERVAELYPLTAAGVEARLALAQAEYAHGRFRRALGLLRELPADLEKLEDAPGPHPPAGAADPSPGRAELGQSAAFLSLAVFRALGDAGGYAAARQRYLELSSGGAAKAPAAAAEPVDARLADLELHLAAAAPLDCIPAPFPAQEASRADSTIRPARLPELEGGPGEYVLEWVNPHWARGTGIAPLEATYNAGHFPDETRHQIFFPALVEGGLPGPLAKQPAILVPGVFHLWMLELEGGKLAARVAKPAAPPQANTFQERSDSPLYVAVVDEDAIYVHGIQDLVVSKQYMRYQITMDIPTRGLAAYDRATGRPRWDTRALFMGSPEDPRPVSIVTPPLVCGERIYVGGVFQAGFYNAMAAALDARTGQAIWKRTLASNQVELTMFGEPAREPLATLLLEREGILYHVTQLGAVASLEARSGRVLWVTTYDAMAITPTLEPLPNLRDIVWGPAAPLFVDGVLYAAPRDSIYLYAWDTGLRSAPESRPGRVLAKHYNVGGKMRDVLGYRQGRIYLSGPGGVQALETSRVGTGANFVRLDSSKLALGGRRAIGRAALAEQGVVFTSQEHLQLVDYDLGQVVDLTQHPFSEEPFLSQYGSGAGNVTLWKGRVIVTSRDLAASFVPRQRVPGREF
jgi:hypothetical protein